MLDITQFGATPNTGELCTAAIQAALDAAQGGTVRIPAGEFLTGTLDLKGASLHLAKGAVLKGSPDMADYVWNGYDHNEMGRVLSLITCMDCDNILITGEGTIDLNGDAFYHLDRPNVPKSAVPLTPAQLEECTRLYDARPNQPIFFLRCRRVTVQDVRIVNAPCWTMSFVECEDVKVLDLTIDNNLRLPNNDGMHFCSCRGVIVRGCHISAGDDCIALSAITDWDKPCEDVVISDCILRSCSKAVVVGYMHSIVRNVVISNVIIRESNRGLTIMTSSRTGLVENVQATNVRIDTRVRAGGWWGNGEAVCIMATHHHLANYARPEPAPRFDLNVRNVTMNGLQCTSENALAIVGEGDNVRDVRLLNVDVTLKDSDNRAIKGDLIDLSPGEQNARLPQDGTETWLFLQGVQDVLVANAWVHPFHGRMPVVVERNCQGVTFR